VATADGVAVQRIKNFGFFHHKVTIARSGQNPFKERPIKNQSGLEIMKIAHVITRSSEVGGAHIHVRDLSRWLLEQGHEVKVFVGGEGAFIDVLKEASLPYTQLKYMKRPISPLNDIIAIKELANALKSFQPDIVSAHSAKAGIIARVACAITGIPCVFTAHGWSFTDGVKWPASFIFWSLEKLLAPFSKTIITVCESDRTLALDKKIARPEKIRTIHNGMPSIDLSALDTAHLPAREAPTLVMIARFEDQKDHRTLINALCSLKDLPWNLQLVGDGPLLDEIKALASSYGLVDRILYMGRRRDIPEILQRADIFVLSTNWEGFPLSILEAMRAGLPVVATKVAGIPESVEDEVTGYLIPPKDSKLLSQRIRQLLESESLRKELGAKGLEHFQSSFTFEKMANATLALYEEILATPSDSNNA